MTAKKVARVDATTIADWPLQLGSHALSPVDGVSERCAGRFGGDEGARPPSRPSLTEHRSPTGAICAPIDIFEDDEDLVRAQEALSAAIAPAAKKANDLNANDFGVCCNV